VTIPIASHATQFQAVLHPLAGNVSVGYAVTEDATGAGFVVATTAAVAASYSGRIKGIAIQAGSGGRSIEIQQDAVARPDHVPFVGTGNATDYAVVDSLGRVVRSSTRTTLTVGTCGADGSVIVDLAGFGSASTALAGDVTGDTLSNTVEKIRNRAVSASAPSTGNHLGWDGAQWAPASLNLAGGANYVTGVLPIANVALASPGASGNVLTSNGSAWVSQAPATVTWGADLLGSTNSAQTVVSLSTANATIPIATASLAFGTNPAGTGLVRAPNNTTVLAARNSGNSADVPLVAITAFDDQAFGSTSAGFSTSLNGATVALKTSGGTQLSASDSLVRLPTGVLALTNNSAATGNVQLPHNATVYYRDSGNAFDVHGLTFSDGNFLIGDGSSTSNLHSRAATSHRWFILSTERAQLTSSQFQLSVVTARWENTVSSPNLTHQARTTNAATTDLTISAQDAWVSATGANTVAGDLILRAGWNSADDDNEDHGDIEFHLVNAKHAYLSPKLGSSTKLAFTTQAPGVLITHDEKVVTDGSAANLTVEAQSRASGSSDGAGGKVIINGGMGYDAGAPGNRGAVEIQDATLVVDDGSLAVAITTASDAGAGSATLPANPVGFLPITINGTVRKIPYYDFDAFSATDTSNMALWFDPSNSANYILTSSRVSQLTDLSGNARHFTQGTAGIRPVIGAAAINGEDVVRFTAANSEVLDGPNFSTIGLTEAEVFVITDCVADSGVQRALWRFGSPADDGYYPFTSGEVYDGFGSTTRQLVGDPTPALTSPRCFNVTSKAGEWTARLDGTQLFTTGTNTVGWTSTTKLGVNALGTSFMDGDVGELIIYNRALTAAERDVVEAYLSAKWGITFA